MDQKNETVSHELTAQTSSFSDEILTIQNAQDSLVAAERELIAVERLHEAAGKAVAAAQETRLLSGHSVDLAKLRRAHCQFMIGKALRGAAVLLCLLLPRFAEAESITIPVTVPPPVPLTVTIPAGTMVTSGGLTYAVTGTLTLTLSSAAPVVAPTPVPTPVPIPVPTTGVTFGGYRDHNRNPVTTAAAGDTLVIQGSGFGTSGATVTFGGVTARVASQTDTEITVTVPNVTGLPAIVVNGVTDTFPLAVTPQTMLLPGTLPGDMPPHDWPPFVVDFHDALGLHIEKVALGDTITLVGNSFGDLGGVVWVGNESVPTASWSDQEIRLRLDPAALGPAPNGSLWVLQRSGGANAVAWGPPIIPAG